MKTTLMKLLVITSLILFTAGCSTVSYTANSNYVGFSEDGVKSVQQKKKTSYTDDALNSTYDDEFVYDDEGDIIKHIQTSYFDNGDKYDEYIVQYQKIGGTVLPQSVSVNGVVYMEVEYEILSADHEGKITEFTSSPLFNQIKPNIDLIRFKFTDYIKYTMDIDVFDVPFRADNRFVSTEEKYAFYSGLSLDKVLTIGYDNIVLKSFYYSPSKFDIGYDLSLDTDSALEMISEEDDVRNTTFTYEWDVVAGKIIQKSMIIKENYSKDYLVFFINREFDQSGRRVSEEWNVNDSISNTEEPVVLFSQKLTY